MTFTPDVGDGRPFDRYRDTPAVVAHDLRVYYATTGHSSLSCKTRKISVVFIAFAVQYAIGSTQIRPVSDLTGKRWVDSYSLESSALLIYIIRSDNRRFICIINAS